VVLNAAPNGGEGIRCGFVVGKKVGGAVGRNRARRLIREALRQRLPLLKPGYDLVWVARSSISEADFRSVQAAIDDLLRRGRLLRLEDSVTDPAQSRIMLEDESPGAGQHKSRHSPAENGSNP
jgi:ribonuclease P protein component